MMNITVNNLDVNSLQCVELFCMHPRQLTDTHKQGEIQWHAGMSVNAEEGIPP